MREAVADDLRRGRGREADLCAWRLRRRRDLRHGIGGPAPAGAESRRGLAPAVAVRGRLRLERGHAHAVGRRGFRPRAHGRLRDHCDRRGRACAFARPRRRRHGPSPACRRIPRLSRRRAAEGGLPVRRALRHRRRVEARPGPARGGPSVSRTASGRRRPRDRRRRRAARRRESRARTARPTAARSDAEARFAGADARRSRRPGFDRRVVDRLQARAADQRVRTPVPARGRAGAAPHRGRARGVQAG